MKLEKIRNALKIFFGGFASALALIAALVCGRKLHSHGVGVRPDSDQLDDCAESSERIGREIEGARGGIAEAQSGIETSLEILRGAKDKSNKG